jgi:hypothetical protein
MSFDSQLKTRAPPPITKHNPYNPMFCMRNSNPLPNIVPPANWTPGPPIPYIQLEDLLLSAATTISTARRSVGRMASTAIVVGATVGVAVVVRAVPTYTSRQSGPIHNAR